MDIATPLDNCSADFTFDIAGMTCASCSGRVEKALQKIPGVTNATVNLATKKAHIDATGAVTSDMLISAVSKAGYDASLATGSTPAAQNGSRLPTWCPVAASALLSLSLILPMLALPFGRDWALPG